MQFGCCIRHPQELPLVKAAGYDFFEFSGQALADLDAPSLQQLLAAAQETALPCVGLNAYCGETPAIVGEQFSAPQTAAYAQLVCERGALLGAPAIHIGSPAARRLPAGYPHELAVRQCQTFLQITAKAAAQKGMRVRFEALNDRCSDFANTTAEAVQIVHAAFPQKIGLVLDFFHMYVMGESLSEAEKALPYLEHVHISTCGEHLQRGYPQEPEREWITQILSWLKQHGYRRTVSIEGDAFHLEEAQRSLRLLRQLDRETGR